ncbi:unnamed protein product [Rotaria magnacalcarata]|uniref:Uncharacterized protein n=1 Tax=Rotaria magnacalcarata TaxID=392030 RepID=A0A820C1A1_9BILA|nr:unnamed protein product [Rotaria magnacalcarata]CAF4201459.1 unnamed protein product [Rotaria magnacalcarata]
MFNGFFATSFFPLARPDVNNNAKSTISTRHSNISVYDKYTIGEDEMHDGVSNRYHKIVRTSYQINKTVASEKLSHSDHARFLIEFYNKSGTNELSENEDVNKLCDSNDLFIQSAEKKNESSEHSKSHFNELMYNNDAKNIQNQSEQHKISGIRRDCGLLDVVKRNSQLNNRRRHKRALKKGMHTANCKSSSTTGLM